MSVAVGKNRARACVEVAVSQAALSADVELWLEGADAGNVAAGVKGFRGLVLDSLAMHLQNRRSARAFS
jgi:hypothetical protein